MPPKIMTSKVVPRSLQEGENFSLYLNHFNRVAAANEWPEQTKLAQLETKLSGRALREFEVFIEEDPAISFDDITEKLVEELVPSPQKALELFTGMRLDDKSPKELYGALVRQSKLAHGDMAEQARHIIVRTQMLQVLPKQLVKDAALQGYLADMAKEEFLTLVTRVFDAGMRDERDGANQYEPMLSRVESSVESRLKSLEERADKRDDEMKEMLGMMRDLHSDRQPSQSRQSYQVRGNAPSRSTRGVGEVTCYRCLQKGHYAGDCPNEVICTKCRGSGHMRAQCPKN